METETAYIQWLRSRGWTDAQIENAKRKIALAFEINAKYPPIPCRREREENDVKAKNKRIEELEEENEELRARNIEIGRQLPGGGNAGGKK